MTMGLRFDPFLQGLVSGIDTHKPKIRMGRRNSLFSIRKMEFRSLRLAKQNKNKYRIEICVFSTKKVLFRSLGLDYERVWNLSKKATQIFLKLTLGVKHLLTTVFVDTRPSKTKHPRKRFQNFRQSYMLSTHRIGIHQSQPASMT